MLTHLVSAQFDLQRNIDDFMAESDWRSTANSIRRIAKVLRENPKMRLSLMSADDVADMRISAEKEVKRERLFAKDEVLIDPNTGEIETFLQRQERARAEAERDLDEAALNTVKVSGSLSVFMTRLEEEYNKSLQVRGLWCEG